MVKLLIFDFDGTLVDTIDDIAYYANKAIEARGFETRSVEVVKAAVGWGVHELLKMMAPGLESQPELLDEAVEEFKHSYHAEPVRRTRPFEGVLETLRGPLKDTWKTIVTNKPQNITSRILSELGMEADFEAVIGMHAGFKPKPDPESVLYLLKEMNVSKSDALFIGDSRVDAETCLAAGVRFVWMDYGYDDVVPAECQYRFSSAREWAGLIR